MRKKIKKFLNIAFVGLITLSMGLSLIPPESIQAASVKDQLKIKDVDKTLDKQNNIFNGKFPASGRQTIMNGLATYDKKMQVLITYSILIDKFGEGSSYSQIYTEPETIIGDVNSALPDYNIPKTYGNKNVIKGLSKASGNKQSLSADDQVTSAQSGEMNTLKAEQKALKPVIEKVAAKIAGYAYAGMSTDKTHFNWVSDTADGGNWSGAFGDALDGWKHPINTFTGKITSKTLEVFTDPSIGASPGNTISNNLYKAKSRTNGSDYSSIKTAVEDLLYKEVGSVTKKGGAKDVISLLENANGKKILGRADRNEVLSPKKVKGEPSSVQRRSGGRSRVSSFTLKPSDAGLDSFKGLGYNDSKVKNAVKNRTRVLTPYNIGFNLDGDKVLTMLFNKNYNDHMSYKYGKLSDEDKKIIEGYADKKDAHSKSQAEKTRDMRAIGWNWVSPYSEGYKKESGKTSELYSTTNSGFLQFSGADGHFIGASPSAFYKQGEMKDVFDFQTKGGIANTGIGWGAKDVQLYFNGKKSGFKAGNSVKDAPNNTQKSIQSGKEPADFKGDVNDVIGFDNYGNVINGQRKPTVLIPYWQNTYAAELLPISNNKFKSSALLNDGEGQYGGGNDESKVSKSDIKSFVGGGANETYKKAAAVSSALSSSPSSAKSFVSTVNKAVGEKGDDKLTEKGAAALAVVISAGTQKEVKAYNKNMLDASRKNANFYVGKSKVFKDKKNDNGSYLYTASDIIQRNGLMSDFGSWDNLRKTIVTALVQSYNSSFMQSGKQNVFYTETTSDSAIASNLGTLPYALIVAIMSIIILIMTFRRAVLADRQVTFMSIVNSVFKVIAIMLIMFINPMIDQLVINKPTEFFINKPMKQQSILDQWSMMRQQQKINNVFYSGLFGDTFGQINKTGSYAINFYTTDLKNGSTDIAVNDKKEQKNLVKDRSITSIQEQVAQQNGNGFNALMSPYRYKTVKIAASDLFSWAVHMDRQLKTSQNAPGYEKGSPVHELENTGFGPGKVPLFVWLDKFYEPLGKDRGDKSDSSEYGTITDGASYGSGESAYGKRRNPADTSLKSAYRTGRRNNQIGDNGEQYRGLASKKEFAVYTKHTAQESDKEYNIDKDSSGNFLTASDLFLNIWETTFSQEGANSTGTLSVNNYLSLMKLAQAINNNMGDQTSEGDENGTDLNVNTIGAVGRKDLINEISMTKEQRQMLNGDAGFSSAAKEVMNGFGISAPTDDWLGLARDNSPLDLVHPYWGKKQQDIRDGLIYKINKQFLNNYLTIYSTVRAAIQPDGADSVSDTSIDDEAGNADVDPFSMAEAQIMALDLFFTINKETGQRMLPTGYIPSSLDLDSWNRILFMPITAMGTLIDDSQYNTDDKINPADLAMQDNVAEYIGINSSVLSLLSFILMNFALTLFGAIITILIKVLFPIWLILSFLRMFVLRRKNISIFSVLLGAFGIKLIIGVMKAILTGTYYMLSASMNNTNINYHGAAYLPVAKNSWIIIAEIVIFILFFIKVYFPALKGDILGFGASNGIGNLVGRFGGAGRGFGSRLSGMRYNRGYNSVFKKNRGNNKSSEKDIAGHSSSIRQKVKTGAKTFGSIADDIKNKRWVSAKNKLRDAFLDTTPTLDGKVNTLLNAKYGNIDKTISRGLDREILEQTEDGGLIDNITKGRTSVDLSRDPDKAALLERIIEANNIKDAQIVRDNKGRAQLVFHNSNNTMTGSQGARKELTRSLMSGLMNEYERIKDLPTGEISRLKQANIGISNENGVMTIPVSNGEGLKNKFVEALINDPNIADKFSVVSAPMQDAKGKYANGLLKLQYLGNNIEEDYNKLSQIASQYAGGNKHKYDSSIFVGAENAAKMAATTAGLVAAGDRILFNSSDAAQKLAAQTISQQIGANSKVNKDNAKDLMNGISSYVDKGDGYGLGETRFDADPNLANSVTKRFRATNAVNAREAISGLKNVAESNIGLLDESRKLEQQFNDEILKAYNNPVSASREIRQILRKGGISTTADTKAKLQELSDIQRSMGPGSIENASQATKDKMNKAYNDLLQSLGDSGQLQFVQNGLVKGTNNANLNRVASRVSNNRERFINSSKVNGNVFNRMTLGQMSEMAGRSAGLENLEVDKNGVLTTSMRKSLDNNITDAKIAQLIRLVG